MRIDWKLGSMIGLLIFGAAAMAVPVERKIVKSASADLNGDKKADSVSITLGGQYTGKYVLHINKKSVKGMLWEGVEGFEVIDLDSKDRYKEIAVFTSGPSDDFGYHLHWYDGKQIRRMGMLPGYARFPGNGSALVSTRVDWAFVTEKYMAYGKARSLRAIPQDIYYVNISAHANKSFQIYSNRQKTQILANIQPKSMVTITGYSPAQRNADGSIKPSKKDSYLVKSHSGLLGWASAKYVTFEYLPDLPAFD